jgi:hypothetical protein
MQEYAGLPVNYSVLIILLCATVFRVRARHSLKVVDAMAPIGGSDRRIVTGVAPPGSETKRGPVAACGPCSMQAFSGRSRTQAPSRWNRSAERLARLHTSEVGLGPAWLRPPHAFIEQRRLIPSPAALPYDAAQAGTSARCCESDAFYTEVCPF